MGLGGRHLRGRSHGGAANGVGLPQDQSVGMGLRAQEIGVEMANALSQIKLNESQANKNEAEANKIKGVDTEAQQATIDNLIAQTSNEKIKRGLLLGQIRVADAAVKRYSPYKISMYKGIVVVIPRTCPETTATAPNSPIARALLRMIP